MSPVLYIYLPEIDWSDWKQKFRPEIIQKMIHYGDCIGVDGKVIGDAGGGGQKEKEKLMEINEQRLNE